MADDETLEENIDDISETHEGGDVDYKALYESEKANAEKWKALSRKNEDAYKKATAKSESDARIKELEARAEKAEQEAGVLRKQKELSELISAVAEKFDFSAEAVSLLKGESEEEITANAERLRALIPTAPVLKDSGKPAGKRLDNNEKTKFVRSLFTGEQ